MGLASRLRRFISRKKTIAIRNMKAEQIHTGDIVDVAVPSGSLKTLVAGLTAARLVERCNGKGSVTVFARSDKAFATLPAGRAESLLKPENLNKLNAILTYHVVCGQVMASESVKLKSAKTVHDRELVIHVAHSNVRVNNSKVVQTDIIASNGVIHGIDNVVMQQSWSGQNTDGGMVLNGAPHRRRGRDVCRPVR